MSTPIQPVQNNNSVLPLRETVINPLALKKDIEAYNFEFVNKLVGYVTPTTAGTYPILDVNGSQLLVPANSYIVAVGVKTLGAPLVGGTSANVQTTDGTIILSAQTTSTVNAGLMVMPGTASLGPANKLIASTTVGTYTAGKIMYNIFYVSLEN